MKSLSVVLLSGIVALGGCADSADVVRTPLESAGMPARSASLVLQSADDVARALALALNHADTRVQVRNAMRASRVTEHKLVLHEFLATPSGRHVLRLAARESGVTSEALLARVRALPPLDFYMPVRDHRLRWRATEEVLVGAVVNETQTTMRAFETTGGEIILQQKDGMPARTLLLLHPAERKSLRIDAQPDVAGDVIQDASDGELSGSIEWVDEEGRVHTTPLASLKRRAPGGNRQLQIGTLSMESPSTNVYSPVDEVICNPEIPTTCPDFDVSPGPASADTTYLGHVEISYDDGWFGGGCELEFYAEYTKDGQVVGRRKIRLDGIAKKVPYYLTEPLIFNEIRPGSADKIRVRVVETDWADSDDQGSIDVYENDRSWVLTIRDSAFWGLTPEETRIALDWYL